MMHPINLHKFQKYQKYQLNHKIQKYRKSLKNNSNLVTIPEIKKTL